MAELIDEGQPVAGGVVDGRRATHEGVDFGDGLADGVVDKRDAVVPKSMSPDPFSVPTPFPFPFPFPAISAFSSRELVAASFQERLK